MFQAGRTFNPPVVVAVKGQQVRFLNDEVEKTWHQVFSPGPTHKFDLGRYHAREARKEQFLKVGEVDVFCNIHKEMIGTVWVLPNSSFVLIAENGSSAPFKLENVPAGTYTLVAWQRLATSPVETRVTVKDGAATRVNLELEQGASPLEQLLAGHKTLQGREYTDENRKLEHGDW
jgi:hypothetical protein